MMLREKLGNYAQEILLAVLLLAMLLVAWRLDPTFIEAVSQRDLLSHVWEVAILALPMTLIIITGGIDLSVGSTVALCSVTMGMLFTAGAPLPLAALGAVMVGGLCGLLNGFFIARVRVHPLIVTLATLSMYRGLAEGLSLAQVYSGFPENFLSLGTSPLFLPVTSDSFFALPPAGWLFIVAALVSALVLGGTPFGRTLYAIGLNEPAARYSGLRIVRAKLLIYTISGLAAGLVAVNYAARRDSAQASVGSGYELQVITAVVLGGTSIFGGRGRILGTVLGVMLVHEMREFVSWHWQKSELIELVLGGLLILSAAAHAVLTRKFWRK